MEPTQKPSARPTPKEDDVDLGRLFYKTGGAINNFFLGIGRFFAWLGKALLLFVFFLRKNILWLLIGVAIGAGYGYYLVAKNGKDYHATMTVQANYNSTRALYNTINIFNALVDNRKTDDLSKIFNISKEEAASLRGFSISPVESELIAAQLYKERFLNLYHNTRVRMDTFWIKTVKYEDFKSSLTKFDYPIHEVKATSNNALIFPKIQQGFVTYVSNNESLLAGKATGTSSNEEEIKLLENSIQSLDTLRNSYNKRLTTPSNSREGTNVTMLDGNLAAANPELQLYDKMLQLKDELKMAKSQAVQEREIIQVVSPFGAMGQSAGFLQQKVVQYSLIGLLLAFIIVGAIRLNKYLTSLEKSLNKDKV